MLLTHKIELDQNKYQEIYFAKAPGIARFAYNCHNWGLCEWTYPEFSVVHDRDINAPKNILNFGLATLVSGSTVSSTRCHRI